MNTYKSSLSRRGFLKLSAFAAGHLLLSGICPASAFAASKKWFTTGLEVPELAPFDQTMLDFMQKRSISNGSLAITRDSRLVFARSYSFCEQKKQAILPNSLFRIASVSKPVTAVAVMQLVQAGLIKLDDPISRYVDFTPMANRNLDPRIHKITIRHVLHHVSGWDHSASGYDPMFLDNVIANKRHHHLPIDQKDIIKYMAGKRLNHAPGSHYAYSNFGYMLLGRLISNVTGTPYRHYIRKHVLGPLGISRMTTGRTLKRYPNEVTYTSSNRSQSVMSESRKEVKEPYGGWNVENMAAHGGWIASSIALARFATAFDDYANCPILSQAAIETMFAKPELDSGEEGYWYGCGWSVRETSPRLTTWHLGVLPGTFTAIIRRWDNLNWVFLFNRYAEKADDPDYLEIDSTMHHVANAITSWPEHDLFPSYIGNGLV